ncbi:MAG TPA: aminotransferase class IV [Acidimicrobiia bacterium]|nr:aminotransferase class IV [Acidimicrobiia bacterium]
MTSVWLDGSLVDVEVARVSPFDHGLLVGDGVFETLKVIGGRPFAWRRHAKRLEFSASGLGLQPPDPAMLRDAADAVIAANGVVDGRLRITVTGGPSALGSERNDVPPTVIVAASDQAPWPPTVKIVTVPWTRNEHSAVAGLKTTSYAANVRALAYARARGGSEAVFANTRGELCEATGSNVFVVIDGQVLTPAAECGCLLGVTRALVLELCAANDIPAAETAVPLDALVTADEVFITSTTRDVHPVHAVDDRDIAAPGEITERLVELFADLAGRNFDP